MNNQIRRVVVLGGNGLVGPYLIERLAASGSKISVVSRTAPDLPAEAEWISCSDLADGHAQLPDASYVISTWPIWVLADHVDKFQSAKHIVALSSTSAVSKQNSKAACERDIARQIIDAERRLAFAAEAADMSFTILRPTIIYDGVSDQSINQIATVMRRFGFFAVAGAGQGLRQPIHADDVALAALHALDNPDAFGQILELTGGETLDYRTFVERIALGLGQTPRIVGVPAILLRAVIRLWGKLSETSLNPSMIDRMNQDLVYDGSEARRRLRIEPRHFYPAIHGPR